MYILKEIFSNLIMFTIYYYKAKKSCSINKLHKNYTTDFNKELHIIFLSFVKDYIKKREICSISL